GHHLARTFANLVLWLVLIAGYGGALLWDSGRRVGRAIALACLLCMMALPLIYRDNLRTAHLETVEHDFLRAALASLPSGVDLIVVPDDEVLYRQSHSRIEAIGKYQMIAASVPATRVILVGMTQFLEHPGDVDCGHNNCLFFFGAPCMGIAYDWFAADGCKRLMTMTAGAPLIERDVVAASFLDCSIYAGGARRRICEPNRKARRFALYRIAE
ncbi:MAG TPA: hypothetical protein VMT89_15960, partial [Candidatus Acidoferrales bacterium]|nr:hypothetical protein [Candidatus Acidoferrales bacterium]